jgi:hypothetical protein
LAGFVGPRLQAFDFPFDLGFDIILVRTGLLLVLSVPGFLDALEEQILE